VTAGRALDEVGFVQRLFVTLPVDAKDGLLHARDGLADRVEMQRVEHLADHLLPGGETDLDFDSGFRHGAMVRLTPPAAPASHPLP
jgi:hypothetical protein